MDEKKYKRLVTIIIVLLTIVILMVSYIIYDTISSKKNLSNNDIVDVPKKDNNSQENEKVEKKEENFDLEKAKKILEDMEYTRFYDVSSDKIETLKLQIAFNKAKSQPATCDSIYNNLPNAKKEEFGYVVTLDDIQETICQGSTKVILYKELDESYKKLFGSGVTISKTDIEGFSYCDGNYDYIESLDAFVHLDDSPDGCYNENKEINIIKSAILKDKQLTIEVSNKILEWNGQGGYDVTLGDKKVAFEGSKVEKSDFDKEFFNQYSQYMNNYKFIFELEEDNYTLKSYKK